MNNRTFDVKCVYQGITLEEAEAFFTCAGELNDDAGIYVHNGIVRITFEA